MDAERAVPVADRWFGPLDPLAPWAGLLLGGAAGLAVVAVLGLDVASPWAGTVAGVAAVLSAAALAWRLAGNWTALDRFVRWPPGWGWRWPARAPRSTADRRNRTGAHVSGRVS